MPLFSPNGASRELIRRCLKGQYLSLIGNALFCEYESVIDRDEIKARCPLNEIEIRALLAFFMKISLKDFDRTELLFPTLSVIKPEAIIRS